MSTKRILRLNASLLKQSACDLKVSYILQGYKFPSNNNDIEFGSAFHLCTKLIPSLGFGRALQEAMLYYKDIPKVWKEKKRYMDVPYLVQACSIWYETLKLKDDFEHLKTLEGKDMVEQTFALPFYSTDQTDVLLEGTIDKVCQHKSSHILAIGDYKTTSMWDAVEYFSSYELSCQLDFYSLAFLSVIENSTDDSVLAPFKGKPLYRFIDGIFCKGKDMMIEVKRSPLFLCDLNKLRVFKDMVLDWVKGYVAKLEAGVIKPTGRLCDACETKYGKCDFFKVCSAPDQRGRDAVLNNNFIIKPYEPLKIGNKEAMI